jgi:hypothetical protein
MHDAAPLQMIVQIAMSIRLWLLFGAIRNSVSFALQATNSLQGRKSASLRVSPCVMCHAANTQPMEHQRAARTSAGILKALRSRIPPMNGLVSPQPLNLETHFFDPSTGLHSEGVWHNCMVGLASVHLLRQQYLEPCDAAKRIADSLWDHSWDGTSFQRRTHSGLWDHSVEPMEQPHYYRESNEHRCVQHGMACVFWSTLVRYMKETNDNVEPYEQQYEIIRNSFVSQFWDTKRWRTVSVTQGGGTVLRLSASSQKAIQGASEPSSYYRAIDQAVGILACLEMRRHDPSDQDIESILHLTCKDLLSTTGFGYGEDEKTRSYMGLNRNRNFWHDGWVMLALTCARHYISSSPQELQSLWKRLLALYGHLDPMTLAPDGTVWHWPTSLKQSAADGNVRFCGDNALLYAITRNLNAEGLDSQDGFWDFIEVLRSRDEEGLACVADEYERLDSLDGFWDFI